MTLLFRSVHVRPCCFRYEKEDAVKHKAIELKNEKVARELQEKKTQLAAEITETRAQQIELDKVATEARNLHDSRQSLLQQFQDVGAALVKRDQQIMATAERVASTRVTPSLSVLLPCKFVVGSSISTTEWNRQMHEQLSVPPKKIVIFWLNS
jgi:hypothetical protein